MSKLLKHTYSLADCEKEVEQFASHLKKGKLVKERDQILPFFKKRAHLTSMFSEFDAEMDLCDRIAHDLDLFRTYRPDIVVGNSAQGRYCFIELEEAKKYSVFSKELKSGKSDWGRVLEHGLGQIIDWMYDLDDLKRTNKYKAIFAKNEISFEVILVAGRNEDFSDPQRERLKFRSENNQFGTKRVRIYTYDDLASFFQQRVRNKKVKKG